MAEKHESKYKEKTQLSTDLTTAMKNILDTSRQSDCPDKQTIEDFVKILLNEMESRDKTRAIAKFNEDDNPEWESVVMGLNFQGELPTGFYCDPEMAARLLEANITSEPLQLDDNPKHTVSLKVTKQQFDNNKTLTVEITHAETGETLETRERKRNPVRHNRGRRERM